jgi:transglutaminase-like putative cysteine protease
VTDLVRVAEQSSDGSTGGFARAAAQLIFKTFRYEKGATHVHSSIHDSMDTRSGVCQDFAHLLIRDVTHARFAGAVRIWLSRPAREGGPSNAMEELIGGMASHAWAEVFLRERDGTGSIRRLVARSTCSMSASRMDATTATWRRSGGCIRDMPVRGCRSTCACDRGSTMKVWES